MDWFNAMNNAVEYMEANITEKLDIDKLAWFTPMDLLKGRQAWCPRYM